MCVIWVKWNKVSTYEYGFLWYISMHVTHTSFELTLYIKKQTFIRQTDIIIDFTLTLSSWDFVIMSEQRHFSIVAHQSMKIYFFSNLTRNTIQIIFHSLDRHSIQVVERCTINLCSINGRAINIIQRSTIHILLHNRSTINVDAGLQWLNKRTSIFTQWTLILSCSFKVLWTEYHNNLWDQLHNLLFRIKTNKSKKNVLKFNQERIRIHCPVLPCAETGHYSLL